MLVRAAGSIVGNTQTHYDHILCWKLQHGGRVDLLVFCFSFCFSFCFHYILSRGFRAVLRTLLLGSKNHVVLGSKNLFWFLEPFLWF